MFGKTPITKQLQDLPQKLFEKKIYPQLIKTHNFNKLL